ncbi:MAG: hypothetical protein MUF79_09145 [Burkholderiales bacterium]|nr:hypothetical protein [Burkholderiales bacterium]
MAARGQPIDSLRELRRLVPSILKEINADPALALRAAANPLLALEELGYSLTPALSAEAERRVRFPKATRERMAVLEKQVFEAAGEHFDLRAPAEVERVLFTKLELPRPQIEPLRAAQRAPAPQQSETLMARLAVSLGREFVDPLGGLAGRHPVMQPLLEYRRLEASEPPLAAPALYERIRRGEVKLPIVRIRGRLKSETAEGDVK